MSASNYFKTKREAFVLRTKDVTANYTVKVGGSSDGHRVDRVITVTNPTANFSIVVPDGSYSGQRLLITLVSHSSPLIEVTVDKTTPDEEPVLGDVGDFLSLEWTNSTSGWVALASQTD